MSAPIYSTSSPTTFDSNPCSTTCSEYRARSGFLTLVVQGPRAALQFEAAYPTHFDKCRQARMIQALGSRHTSVFPYKITLEEYPWDVNTALADFIRRFVPASVRDDHWFYDVSDLDTFDDSSDDEYVNRDEAMTETSAASATQPTTPPVTQTSSPLCIASCFTQGNLMCMNAINKGSTDDTFGLQHAKICE